MHLYARYAREQVMDRISIYRKSMDLVNALCLDRIGSFCYLLDMLSGGVHSASVEEVERVVRNLDKEGCITEIKREGVYEMCEACNGIWKRYLGLILWRFVGTSKFQIGQVKFCSTCPTGQVDLKRMAFLQKACNFLGPTNSRKVLNLTRQRLQTGRSLLTTVKPNNEDDAKGKLQDPRRGEQLDVRPLYMDVQATTPVDPRVLDKMLPYLIGSYGNPHSRTHAYGWESEAAVEKARKQVANLIGADPREIVFTSGATESNNVAIKGVSRFYKSKKRHIITSQTDLEKALTPETTLVSVMTVNNEIGVKQPIQEIGALCREKKVFFHTDAAQAVGKVPLDVNEMKIDLMSISGHKLYGPKAPRKAQYSACEFDLLISHGRSDSVSRQVKSMGSITKGIGALYIRRRPRVRIEAIQSGGGQERGMRSGTVPTPLVVGLGAACQLAQHEMEYDSKRISKLAERLIKRITSQVTHVIRNGDAEATYPGCVNLSFAYVEGESLLMALKDVALSSGSACTSASLEPSYVLRAIGTDEDLAHSSIRFGIGRFTTEEEVDYTADKCVLHVTRLREMRSVILMPYNSSL
ncbi:hypothetical protein LSH36_250g01031 [Paralvinella palmiformis]|uniref:Aminotransferase class V domain-containing protein n=1 Tax=Paralvinella palmiformis TaxID=53620 RepID=A0AAD9JL15_9ANNE|nr:hypothetical protein LSH36_250g01031 [Paralvinella palmiformis]